MQNFKSITPNEPIEGIILRTLPFGEYDLIIKIFTPRSGKISIIAKGVLKEKNKFSTNFDIFDSGAFTTKKGKGSLETLVHYRPYKGLTKLRQDLDRFVISTCIAESFDHLTHEDYQEAQELYETLALSLRAIEEAAQLKEMLKALYFSLHALLQQTGFAMMEDGRIPSRNNLIYLLSNIENFSERELLSKSSVLDILMRYTSKE